MENITPMLKQYQNLKSQHQNSILFFRLGDFYEMFYDDAKISAPILNIVLTSRDSGRTGRIPMCGIPYHSKENYIAKLVRAGLKVSICEQVEDPALAKGIVKRQVIRTITSGTFIDENSYEARYLLSVFPDNKTTGLSFIDLQDGCIHTNQYPDETKIIELISKLPVYECIFPLFTEEKIRQLFKHPLIRNKNITLTPHNDWCFNVEISKKTLCEHFQTQTLRGFGIDDLNQSISSAGALLEYLKQVNQMPMRHICKISRYIDTNYMFISSSAIYGLCIEDLFKTIDKTLTPFGKRCIKNWIYHPLKEKNEILNRQLAVILLRENPRIQEDLKRLFSNLADIEKSILRISCNDAAPKDLIALRNTLSRLPELINILMPFAQKNRFFLIEDLPEIRLLLIDAINPDIPLSNPEGKIIQQGFNSELDSIRGLQENARQLLKELQAKEIKRTGINSLKIGYNQVFGYYIEITKANLDLAPSDYTRKQTLANAERFVTAELKEYEEKMLKSQDDILRIEKQILEGIYKKILDNANPLNALTAKLANLDALYSLSAISLSADYTAPEISEASEIIINDGRHPVVENSLNSPFIPNDTHMDSDENHLIIITGPNMSGKSTYIRQTALLVIMAQIGSFIPAKSAKIGLVDKIFTRIGAHDEITKGQSTFMVEMNETAEIINNLSARSLVILDEIGRGTSTYDGLSLAWAIAEFLQKQKTRTLFATHFHELTALAKEHPGIKNYNVAIKEWNNEIVFLHKIIPGGTDKSYGLYVAKLAGIPHTVIQRAKQILTELELSGKLHDKITKPAIQREQIKLPLVINKADTVTQEIKDEITKLDINSVTPLQALSKINEWKEKINKNG